MGHTVRLTQRRKLNRRERDINKAKHLTEITNVECCEGCPNVYGTRLIGQWMCWPRLRKIPLYVMRGKKNFPGWCPLPDEAKFTSKEGMMGHTVRLTQRRKLNRREMDIEKAKHLKWLLGKMSLKGMLHAINCLRSGRTMVDTGAHTGYSIKIDRRDGRERRVKP